MADQAEIIQYSAERSNDRAHPHAPNPLQLVHRLLRGRYWLSVPLGILLAAVGGAGGFLATRPTYVSTGIVRISPTLPSLVHKNEENQNLPFLDAFVATQMSLVGDQRVIDWAVASDALRNLGWPAPPEGTRRLQAALEVTNPRRSLVLLVSVTDTNPRLAQAAVNGVLDGYQSLFAEESSGVTLTKKVSTLEALKLSLSIELKQLRENIVNRSSEQGMTDLRALEASRTEDLLRLDRSISELELQIFKRESESPASKPEGATPAPKPADDAEALAERDAMLRGLLARLRDLRSRDAVLAQTFGPKHKTREQLADEIAQAQADVDARVESLKLNPPEVEVRGLPAEKPLPLADSKQLLQQLKARREELAGEVRTLSINHLNISRLQEQADDVSKELNGVSDRLRQLNTEREYIRAGRISVDGRGTLPVVPAADRRVPLAAGGALGGLAFGMAVPALIGLLRPRHRYIDEVEAADSSLAFLGTMPDLSKAKDPDAAELASLAVHHIRNLILLRAKRAKLPGGCVILVTSPGPGDGKTSLCMALGASLSVANFKTVLVDADLCGHGLTSRNGLLGREGFSTAVLAGKANGEIIRIGATNLSILPIGDPARLRPEELSHDRLAALLASLRQTADFVLIDSGPLLGSLEAALLAPDADGVIVVCSRGGSPKLTAATIAKLRSLSARAWGLVFNRAEFSDVLRSASSTSVVSRSAGSQDPPSAESLSHADRFVDAMLRRK